MLIVAALVTVYIVLGVLYESYIHPITILSTLPSAGVGALLALLMTHTDLSVIGLIGIILLIGIVKKNAIMMIDFALEAERNEGMTPDEAIYQACLLRFRPIMMTTMAALLGAVPLAIGTGTGSEMRRPLGITIIGGLIFSQVLTLYTTPVIYLAFERLAGMFGTRHVWRPGAWTHRGWSTYEPLVSVHSPPRGNDTAHRRHHAGGSDRVHDAPRVAATAGRVSHDLGFGLAARRQRRDDGFGRGHAARAAIRPHRRHHRDELQQLSGQHVDHDAVRFESQHRCCGPATCKRPSTGPRGQLPTNLPSNPTWRKINPADAPILILAMTSKTYPKSRIYDAASTILAQKLSQTKGVGQVMVSGGLAAGGACGRQSHGAEPLRLGPGRRPHSAGKRQRQSPQGAD